MAGRAPGICRDKEKRDRPIVHLTISVSVSGLLGLPNCIDRESFRRHQRLSVSILEEGGRLGLKCLLMRYFRMGDNPTVICDCLAQNTMKHSQRRRYKKRSSRVGTDWSCRKKNRLAHLRQSLVTNVRTLGIDIKVPQELMTLLLLNPCGRPREARNELEGRSINCHWM
jgi:hypothetical protein